MEGRALGAGGDGLLARGAPTWTTSEPGLVGIPALAVGSEPDRIETLYRSVIRLCDALDVDVIAEGIESGTQADTVFAAGCRVAQGHLFGRAPAITDLSFRRATVSAPQHAVD